ncbi:Uracil-DNA glycosylase [Brevibacterium antiquum]|uniref:Uracil-DNA glycosylase n=3 Tax=Brevibacteriaceae TaxID=85019 RepID=A0A2H1JZQ4_9MICO|nr:Uracil-DNA glycosylase [Brevibacterium antiquum]SMX92971.1 Uracil-DNA glycosylase [Brevibacterium antiquum CNRZ 918]
MMHTSSALCAHRHRASDQATIRARYATTSLTVHLVDHGSETMLPIGRIAGMTSTAELTKIMSSDWATALSDQADRIHAMGDFLREEVSAGRSYLPSGDKVFRAFAEPLTEVKVLIVGQDPYPTPGHAIGLSFAVDPEVRPLPRSLKNIYKELAADLGIEPAAHGDLQSWSRQGVMLLNRVLTVAPGEPASHRKRGWEAITEQAIAALVDRDQPLVAILWGREARNLAPMLRSGRSEVAIIESAHPSPLSASRGFFGSQPFSRTNDLLVHKGMAPIDWSLPPQG